MSKRSDTVLIVSILVVDLAVVAAIVRYAGFYWEQVVLLGVVVFAGICFGLWLEDFKRRFKSRKEGG